MWKTPKAVSYTHLHRVKTLIPRKIVPGQSTSFDFKSDLLKHINNAYTYLIYFKPQRRFFLFPSKSSISVVVRNYYVCLVKKRRLQNTLCRL